MSAKEDVRKDWLEEALSQLWYHGAHSIDHRASVNAVKSAIRNHFASELLALVDEVIGEDDKPDRATYPPANPGLTHEQQYRNKLRAEQRAIITSKAKELGNG